MKNKPIKIIELSGFNPNKIKQHPSKDSDYYYVASWAGLFARRLKKRYPKLDIEVWRTEPEFNSITEETIFGLKGMIFPYKKPIVPKTITLKMVKRLRQYQKEYQLIIHFNTIFDVFFNQIIPRLLPDTKIILSHHGGVPPIRNSIKQLLKKKMLENSYKHFNAITYLRKEIKNWLLSTKKCPPLYFLPVGADFEIFHPLDKLIARKKLGLDESKTYGIYIGNFYRLKSVDILLNTYNKFADKYNFSIIFVGGKKNNANDLYDEVINSGCPCWGYQNWRDLRYFLSAADFYIHPVINKKFGGFDVSLIEAMAINIPVLSPQLKELDFDYSDLGMCIKNGNEVEEKVEYMINNYHKYKKCREVAQKYLDGNNAIIDKLKKILMS